MPRRKPRSARPLTPIERLDIKVARAVALDRRRKASRWVTRFAELGDQPPLVALSLGVAAVGALRRDERLARTGLRMLAAHSLTTIAKILGKGLIDRTRPEDAPSNGRYRLEEGDSHDGRLRSMPSGHSAGSAAVAIAAARDYPQLGGLAAGLSGAVMFAQLPAKNHFMSDVIGGAALGVAAAMVAESMIPVFEELKQEPGPPRAPRP